MIFKAVLTFLTSRLHLLADKLSPAPISKGTVQLFLTAIGISVQFGKYFNSIGFFINCTGKKSSNKPSTSSNAQTPITPKICLIESLHPGSVEQTKHHLLKRLPKQVAPSSISPMPQKYRVNVDQVNSQ